MKRESIHSSMFLNFFLKLKLKKLSIICTYIHMSVHTNVKVKVMYIHRTAFRFSQKYGSVIPLITKYVWMINAICLKYKPNVSLESQGGELLKYCTVLYWRVTQGFSWVFMINKLGRVIVSLIEVHQSTTKEIIAFMFENYLRTPNQRES